MKTFRFGRRQCAGLGVLALFGASALFVTPAARAQDSGKPVTINIQNAPIGTVLRSLFKSAGKNYTIAPGATGTVTVDVNQVPFDTALSAILAGTNPPLEAPIVNGVYQVGVEQAQPQAPAANVDRNRSSASNTPTTDNDPRHPYRIPISHYDAAYMAYLVQQFSRKGGPPILVPSDPTSMMGGGMGGMGGGMGGMGGGMMGGMGGGMMGGMGGMMGGMGGMMGGMGGMGGGMMGGMGGMMGGGMGGFGGGMGGFGGGMGGFGGGRGY